MVCKRCNFYDEWEVIQKGLERIFKVSYQLQLINDDRAVFISRNPKEEENMISMGVCRLSNNLHVRLKRWYPAINKEENGWLTRDDGLE